MLHILFRLLPSDVQFARVPDLLKLSLPVISATMSSASWPPQLKYLGVPSLLSPIFLMCPRREWVAKCLGQMTDTNRAEAQAELRQVISDAFSAQTLWTTDWQAVQLQRCRTIGYPVPTH